MRETVPQLLITWRVKGLDAAAQSVNNNGRCPCFSVFISGRQIAGAPGRIRTRDPRFRKPMTHHSHSPTK